MRISDWSSDVCSSDLGRQAAHFTAHDGLRGIGEKRCQLLARARAYVPRVSSIELTNRVHVLEQRKPRLERSAVAFCGAVQRRSEERRVGKEGVRTCRSRWARDNKKKKEYERQL